MKLVWVTENERVRQIVGEHDQTKRICRRMHEFEQIGGLLRQTALPETTRFLSLNDIPPGLGPVRWDRIRRTRFANNVRRTWAHHVYIVWLTKVSR